MSAPLLFDGKLLQSRQARAARQHGADTALMPHLVQEMADRLGAIVRPFPVGVDLGTPLNAFAPLLRAHQGNALTIAAGTGGAGNDTGTAITIDMEALPFGRESVDVVVSGMAMHTVNDLPGTLSQIRAALRPDGLFLGVWPGGDTLQELREAFSAAELAVTGGVTPRVFPRMDVRDVGSLMQRAGFALPVVDRETVTVRYSSLFALFHDLRMVGGTNIMYSRSRKPLKRAVLQKLLEIYQARFADSDGKLRVSVEMIWALGWAPHTSQQQPLKPGSAKMRLADALKTGSDV